MDLDDFSDDGFDGLTANALHELEKNAIHLTQAKPPSTRRAHRPPSPLASPSPSLLHRLSDYGWEQEDDDLDTTEVTNDVGAPIGRPVVDSALQQRQLRLRHQQHQHQHQHQHHLEPPRRQAAAQNLPRRAAAPPPNPQWNPAVDPANRSAPGPRPSAPQRFQPQPSQFARPLLPHGRFAASSPASQAPPAGDVASALQHRLRSLENELNVARGEASILRANLTKTQQDYDAQIARLKRDNTAALAEQERLVEDAVAAERSATTELHFLQRDMRELNHRSRGRDAAAAAAAAAAVPTTPKKAGKTWGIADGFDQVDIALSPSRGQARGKGSGSVAATVGERTPSKGKRKRPVVDSPIAALETHSDDVDMAHTAGGLPSSPPAPPALASAAPTAPFEFLQLVLDHGSFRQQPPTFDTLSRFSFPSDPTATSLAVIIFEKLPLMGDARRPMQLLVDFAEHVVAMWTRCLEEQFWEPVKYLVALVAFTLDLHAVSVAPLVAANLVAAAQPTLLALAEARRRLPEGGLAGGDEHGFLEEHIDATRILSLLNLSALACATTPSQTQNGFECTAAGFWRLMSLDLVLALLSPKQKPDVVAAMLNLLASSSQPDSIGPVAPVGDGAHAAAAVARAVIDRVSAKLTEQPRAPAAPQQRRSLRLAALRTLVAFARHPFGALQLASHDSALPRLVACLGASMDELYDQLVPPTALPPPPPPLGLPQPAPSADLYQIISQSVLLVHALVTSDGTSDVADISHKLSLTHAGSQRYLLALGRLTFAEEGLVIEAGIDSDVVEAAHELLEMAVTPDEGQAVSEAFGEGHDDA